MYIICAYIKYDSNLKFECFMWIYDTYILFFSSIPALGIRGKRFALFICYDFQNDNAQKMLLHVFDSRTVDYIIVVAFVILGSVRI